MGDAAPRLHVEERHGVVPSVGAEQPSHCHVGDGAVIGVPDLCTVQYSTVQYSTVPYLHWRLQLVLTCGPPPGVLRQWWSCSLGILMFSTLAC